MKSALPVAAREVSAETLVDQTAPLCPIKVPIQSPLQSRIMGLPSLQLETRTYVLSFCSSEKLKWTTGLENDEEIQSGEYDLYAHRVCPLDNKTRRFQ